MWRRSDPWREAEARENITVLVSPLPEETGGAVAQMRGRHAYIIIDPLLSPVEQRCRLAHEMVHLERGSSVRCRWSPGAWDVAIVREEVWVDREVVEWLIPRQDLIDMLNEMSRAGLEVTVRDIAHEFEVTKQIARMSLDIYRLDLPSVWGF